MAKSEFTWVRSIFGKGPDAKKQYSYISDGGINDVIKDWHEHNEDVRDFSVASPSGIATCPRVIWLLNKGVKPTNDMTWAVKQRLLLGRLLENLLANQLKDEGKLLYHFKDDPGIEVEKFTDGIGDYKLTGVPDYILGMFDTTVVSDAKTSRSDSFGYVPLEYKEAFEDWNWHKYKVQLDAYYKLCHANKKWFEDNKIPLPEKCHLFSYALDDGVARRDFVWTPTPEDLARVERYTLRYNQAVKSETMPECTCRNAEFEDGEVKFCKFGQVEPNEKVATDCCSDSLIELI